MAEKFPNISVINLSETLARFTSVLGKLGKVLRFIAIFCLSAGFLIIISAFMATRLTRIKEIVYYKVLGANEHMIIKIYALESALIAVVSVSIAFLIANAATAILSFFVFDLAYQPVHIKLSALAFLFVMGVSLLGIITTRPISKYRPMRYLRNQEE
jgi:putative ABC transport system permease protein